MTKRKKERKKERNMKINIPQKERMNERTKERKKKEMCGGQNEVVSSFQFKFFSVDRTEQNSYGNL